MHSLHNVIVQHILTATDRLLYIFGHCASNTTGGECTISLPPNGRIILQYLHNNEDTIFPSHQTNTTLTRTDNNPPASLSNQRNKETRLTCTRGEIITLMYRHFLNTYPTSLDKMDKDDDFTHSLSHTHCLTISLIVVTI